MTVPLIMHIFGTTSLFALPANLLTVTLIPLAMFLTVVGGVGAWVSPGFGGWWAWPAKIILTYILSISSFLANLPHAVWRYQTTWYEMVESYVLIILLCLVLSRKVRLSYVKITDEDTRFEGATI